MALPPEWQRRAGVPEGAGLILFDGDCGFCTRSVQFVAARDPAGRFYFAPLQSGLAQSLLGPQEASPSDPDTFVLIEGGRAYARSEAGLRVLRRLRWPWPALYALILVPRPLRDAAYDWVARNRHRLAGPTCPLPSPQLRAHLLDDEGPSP